MIAKKSINCLYFRDITILSLKYTCFMLSIFLVNINNKLRNTKKHTNTNNKLRIFFDISNYFFSLLLVYTNLLLDFSREYKTFLKPNIATMGAHYV